MVYVKYVKNIFSNFLNLTCFYKFQSSYAELNLKWRNFNRKAVHNLSTRGDKKIVEENNNSLFVHVFVVITSDLS